MGFFLLLSACNSDGKSEKKENVPDAEGIITITGNTMGTTYSIKYVPDKSFNFDLKEAVDKRLVEINKAVSTYDKESELSELNRTNVTERKIFLSDDLFTPLENAYMVSSMTKGVFDLTIGPLVNLWGFGPDGKRRVPSQKEINEAKKRVGYRNLFPDLLDFSVIKKKGSKDIYIDLSATAKGYAVDQVSDLLFKEAGIKNFMVEIGGEIKAIGNKGSKDKHWKIGIESPDPNAMNKVIEEVLDLSNIAMATSGNYRNFFEENGKKYSHTIDYKTGKPVDWIMASVTVLDLQSCMNADSLATALMAMGPEKGIEFAKKYKIAAYFIYSENGKIDGKFIDFKTKEFDAHIEHAKTLDLSAEEGE